MGRKNKKGNGYKGVECQDIQRETPPRKNPFIVVGDARPSHTGQSLAMRIKHSDGIIHHYTLARKDIERVFLTPLDAEMIAAPIREYFNELNKDED